MAFALKIQLRTKQKIMLVLDYQLTFNFTVLPYKFEEKITRKYCLFSDNVAIIYNLDKQKATQNPSHTRLHTFHNRNYFVLILY